MEKKPAIFSEKGVIGVLALFLMLVLILFALATALLITSQYRNMATRLDEVKALYISEAGIERGIWRLSEDSGWDTGYSSVSFENGEYTLDVNPNDTGLPYPNWLYKKIVEINNGGNPNNLTDYQVKITVEYESHMKSDFSDIRFADTNGNSLSYWIEDYTVSDKATVWVKVPQIPANSKTNIYLFYGNPLALDASNGDNTFLFFDDFSGASLDSNKWNINAVNHIAYQMNAATSYFRFRNATKGNGDYWIYDNTDTGSQHQARWTPVSQFVVEWHSKISDIIATQMGEGSVALVGADNKITAYITHNDPLGSTLAPKVGSIFIEGNTAPAFDVSNGDERDFQYIVNGNSITITQNGNIVLSGTSSDISKLALAAGAYGGYPFLNYIEITKLKVRKYTDAEPSISVYKVLQSTGNFRGNQRKLKILLKSDNTVHSWQELPLL